MGTNGGFSAGIFGFFNSAQGLGLGRFLAATRRDRRDENDRAGRGDNCFAERNAAARTGREVSIRRGRGVFGGSFTDGAGGVGVADWLSEFPVDAKTGADVGSMSAAHVFGKSCAGPGHCFRRTFW